MKIEYRKAARIGSGRRAGGAKITKRRIQIEELEARERAREAEDYEPEPECIDYDDF